MSRLGDKSSATFGTICHLICVVVDRLTVLCLPVFCKVASWLAFVVRRIVHDPCALFRHVHQRDMYISGFFFAGDASTDMKKDESDRLRVIHITVSNKHDAAYIQPCGQLNRRPMCGTSSPKSHLISNSPRSRSIRV